jgi:Family of unknown function (DUF6131)
VRLWAEQASPLWAAAPGAKRAVLESQPSGGCWLLGDAILIGHASRRSPARIRVEYVCSWVSLVQAKRQRRSGERMITLGIILLIIGLIAKVAILWTIGIILLVIGLIAVLLGSMGRAVGGRRHYY